MTEGLVALLGSQDPAFCITLGLIFCLSFLATWSQRRKDEAFELPPDFCPIPPSTPSRGKAAEEEIAHAAIASPKTTKAIRVALEPVLYTLPDPSGAPLLVDPKQAPAGALPPKVAANVQALRKAIEAHKGGWSAAVRAEAESMLDDFTLARWVTASHPQSPFISFQKGMEWRVEHGVGQLYAELHPLVRTQATATPRQKAVQQNFYGGIGGLARDGTPFMVERLGRADFAGYGRQAEVMALMKEAYIAHLETLTRAVRVAAATQGRFAMGLVIIDTKGIGGSIIFNLTLVKYAAKMGLANFPEGTDEVYVVNAPAVVARVFGMIGPMLPEDTRKKVKIISEANTRAALEKKIDPSEIPAFLGGDKKDDSPPFPHVTAVPKAHVEGLARL